MLKGLGATVRHVAEPFTPEPGAYDGSHSLLFAPGHGAHSHGARPWMNPLPARFATQFQLLAWCSPAYPTGAFSYSHGMEWAVERGTVATRDGLLDFVIAVLQRGGGWVDAVLFAHAWRAAQQPPAIWQRCARAQLRELAELAAAFRGSAETALESRQQGAAFLEVTLKAWPHPRLSEFAERRARPADSAVRRGRRRLCDPRYRAVRRHSRLCPGHCGQSGIGGRAPDSAGTNGRADRRGATRARGGCQRSARHYRQSGGFGHLCPGAGAVFHAP